MDWDSEQFDSADSTEESELRKALEAALQALNGTMPQSTIDTIYDIIMTNFDRKRVQSFLNLADSFSPANYVERVATNYQEHHTYIEYVLSGTDEVWYDLYEKMQQWALFFQVFLL